jgi:hypothetical protein
MLLYFSYVVFVSLLELLTRRGCDRVTAPSSPRRAACYRPGAAMVCSSRRRPCSAGIASSCDGGGHPRASGQGGRRSRREARARPASRARGPTLGLPADLRRAHEARLLGLAELRPGNAARIAPPTRLRSSSRRSSSSRSRHSGRTGARGSANTSMLESRNSPL